MQTFELVSRLKLTCAHGFWMAKEAFLLTLERRLYGTEI